MTGMVLFLALPLIAAALAYTFRQWRNVSFPIAVGVSLALGLLLLFVPLDQPITVLGREVVLGGAVTVLGRELVLGTAAQTALAFLFLTGAGLFLLAWWLAPEGLLSSVGLALLSLLGGVLLIRPLIYAALLFQIAAALSILALHADPRSPVRGGLRYLTFVVLALPGLMVSHWMLDMYAVTPDQPGLLYGAAALVGFSFALLLGVVPFHPWVPAVARDGAPLASALLFSASGGTVWFLLLSYLQTYPWLVSDQRWVAVLTALGVITAIVGGLLGMTQRGPGALMGYAVMVDTGLLLAGLGQSSRTGVDLTVALVFARSWSLALMGAGLAGLRLHGDEAQPGLARRAPWSTVALAVGGLSLVGFPPTVGFAPHWGLYRLLFHAQPVVTLLLMLASAGPLVGLLRLLYRLLSRPPRIVGIREEGEGEEEEVPVRTESPAVVVVLLLLAAGAIGLGLFPTGIMRAAARLGASFTIWGP